MQARFSEPTDDDYAALAKRWLSISALAREEYDYVLCQSIDDLAYLQRVIDDNLIDARNRYATECLGLAFGRVMISTESDFDWWVIEDDFGRDIIVRYGRTSLQIDAMHLIGKRLEEGESIDVRDLYDGLMEKLNDIKGNVE